MEETLLNYLRRENPTVAYIPKKSKSKSTTICRTYFGPKYIARWKEFNTELVHGMYSDILRHVETRDRIEFQEIHLRVRNETGFEKIVGKWNEKIVFKALQETGECMGRDDLVYIVPGVMARPPRGPTTKYRPDWGAITKSSRQEADEEVPDNSLPGDTKYSEDWTSASVEEGDCRYTVDSKNVPRWFWPIAQIYSYCYWLEKRYAYIITDKELVLFRVGTMRNSPNPSPKSEKFTIRELDVDGKIEFVSVPWTNGRNEDGVELGDPNGLSINTALWWLHLQATKGNSVDWTYPPLQDDALSYTALEDGIQLPRNNSCRLSADDTQAERTPSVASEDRQEDQYELSFMQEEAELPAPEPSAEMFGMSLRNRRIPKRNRTTSSFSSTPNESFVSHSSATSNKNRVDKAKRTTAKRGRSARLN